MAVKKWRSARQGRMGNDHGDNCRCICRRSAGIYGWRVRYLPGRQRGWIGRNSNNDPNLSRLVGAYPSFCQTYSSPPIILSEDSGKVPVKKKGEKLDKFN